VASGINEEKVNSLNVELLDAIENLNSISNRLDICMETIKGNMDGYGKSEILSKLSAIKQQLPVVSSNISAYIDDLGKAVNRYRNRDEEVATTLMNNIGKLDEGRE
jgi:hypothetical protein